MIVDNWCSRLSTLYGVPAGAIIILMNTIYQTLGLISLVGVSLLGTLAIFLAPKGKDDSISGSIASHKLLFIASGVVITSLAALFCISLLYWYVPTYSLPNYATWLIILFLLLATIMAWTPADAAKNKRLRDIHFVAGQMLGLVIVTLLATMLLSAHQTISTPVRIVVSFTVGYSLVCYVLYITVPKLRDYFLYFEISVLAAIMTSFFLLVLSL